ncbi:MAG: MarR family transcriptional regulator, partial [Actinomycetota bacterium]
MDIRPIIQGSRRCVADARTAVHSGMDSFRPTLFFCHRPRWSGTREEAKIRFAEPLDDALRSRGHVRVLRALARTPQEANVSARAIARRAGMSHPRVATVLADLARQGIV